MIDKDVVQFASSCVSGGTLDIFIEPVLPISRLLIVGSSPVAINLCDLAENLDFAMMMACSEKDTNLFANANRTLAGYSDAT